jgi:hypothetical protein
VDARLHADLGGAEVERVLDAAGELLARVLVGVGRALALAEAAERAADHADVGDVDVAVDDERHRVARELGRSSSAAARMSSIASGRVSANIAVISSRLSSMPARARSIVAGMEVGRGPSAARSRGAG